MDHGSKKSVVGFIVGIPFWLHLASTGVQDINVIVDGIIKLINMMI